MFDRICAYGKEFLLRFWNVRLLVLALIWLVSMDTSMGQFRNVARELNGRGNFVILPFLQNNSYFQKMMLSAVVCFYSNAPFMDRHALYQVHRIGKRRWGLFNHIYLLVSSAALSILLFVLSVLLSGGFVTFTDEWGSLYQTFANGAYATPGISVSSSILQKYHPFQLLAMILAIDMLAFSVIGMFVYTLSLFVSREAACFLALVAVFITTLDEWFPIYLFSPLSWLKYSSWRKFYEPNRPDTVYIFTMYLLLLLIGSYFSQRKLAKMDWKNYESS